MANQAFKDYVNGTSTSRQGLLDQIAASIGMQNYYSSANSGGLNSNLSNAATREYHKQSQLKQLLNAGSASGAWDATGGAGSGSGGGGGDVGAPATSNRFEPGLSDVEMRLKSLLDNPDSINQSAAYKFRVGQGQEALQRSMGARGMLKSGNRLMELQKYGQDMGSQEYDAQAGRLAGLLGNYSQGWLGDKNANTGIYSAQQTAKANNDRNRLGWAGLAWDMNKPQVVGGSRSSGGGETQGPLYGYGQSATSAWNDVLQNDLMQAKIQQTRGY